MDYGLCTRFLVRRCVPRALQFSHMLRAPELLLAGEITEQSCSVEQECDIAEVALHANGWGRATSENAPGVHSSAPTLRPSIQGESRATIGVPRPQPFTLD